MGDAHRGFRFLHVLAARTGSAEDVNAKVRRINRDFNGIVDLGVDVDAGKGRVAAGVGVKGAFSHQTVNAGFSSERAVGPFALDKDRAAFDPCDVTLGFFGEFGGKPGAFGIPQIHALKHRGPVLGFGAACARLNFEVAVGAVHRLIEHALEFELFNVFFKAFDFGGNRFGAGFIVVG